MHRSKAQAHLSIKLKVSLILGALWDLREKIIARILNQLHACISKTILDFLDTSYQLHRQELGALKNHCCRGLEGRDDMLHILCCRDNNLLGRLAYA